MQMLVEEIFSPLGVKQDRKHRTPDPGLVFPRCAIQSHRTRVAPGDGF